MSRDPMVDEIHEIRKRIRKECGNDPRRYFQRLKAAEAKDKARLVTRPPSSQPEGARRKARPELR